tara:strand:+ start:884 stop:1762 length:879 start_codon:yes stop_codon:yes gene_type:complete
MNIYKPRFPVYIISKGRWKRKPTVTTFELLNIPYKIVVEKQEYKKYAKEINSKNILILPQKYLDEYDTFWERSKDNRTGPGPARNFCWEHSIKSGYEWHWVFDDNIESIERFNNNLKIKCKTSTPLYIVEDFVLRYKNIVQAGFGYSIFCPATDFRPPVRFNTRIYSNQLIKNNIPYRWRGRYNEDTDLSLRILKDGYCTVEFNAFLIGKRGTQTMSGGNTDEFYKEEGTLNKSQMLVDMHPDIAKLTKRWNRWHHYVNYKPFKKNKLIKKKDIAIKNRINEYGMILNEQRH